MERRICTVRVDEVDFHCEIRGNGPTVVLVPDGSNDCEPYDNLSRELCDEFTVLTFDMRGGTRSMDPDPHLVTPRVLADDVAGIIRALDLGPASVYGCSSGGQAVLALAKYHPELVRNAMVHEAALQSDTPLPGTGFEYFRNLASFADHLDAGLTPGDVWGVVDAEKVLALGDDTRARIAQNNDYWGQWYLPHVADDSYTSDDFAAMPPVSFTVGTWSPAWLVYANRETARRGNCPITWVECAHHPEITCPEQYAQHLRTVVRQYTTPGPEEKSTP